MNQHKKPEVRLWSDESREAKKLRNNLMECGYEVNNYFSGSGKPTAFSNGHYTSGYSEIRSDYCSGSAIHDQNGKVHSLK